MSKTQATYEITLTITVKQGYSETAVLQHKESINVEVEDFPGITRVTNQFHRAWQAMQKLGKRKV